MALGTEAHPQLSGGPQAGSSQSPHWAPHSQPCLSLPAVPLQPLGLIRAVEKLPFEELHRNDSKYEHEEHIDNQDVEDVLQRVHHTVKHSLEGKRAQLRTSGPPSIRGPSKP